MEIMAQITISVFGIIFIIQIGEIVKEIRIIRQRLQWLQQDYHKINKEELEKY